MIGKILTKLLLLCVLPVLFLQGCADGTDHAAYVKAMLDTSYKADFSEYMALKKISEEEALEQYDRGIEAVTTGLCDSLGIDIPQESREKLNGIIKNVFMSASYEVLGSTKINGSQYDVLVNIYPILNFKNIEGELAAFAENFLEMIYTPGLQDESPEYVYEQYLNGLLDIIEEGVATIEYGEVQELTVPVMYDKNEKTWYVTDEWQNEIFDTITGI